MSLDRRAMENALPGYDIGRELGRGASGVVHEGRHRDLDRPVAVKQLPRALAADPTVRQRFLTEARTAAALQHPHIVPVYDFVERDGLCLLVMERMSGGSLAERLAAGPLDTATACRVTSHVASALAHAHDRGVLHRDVKPENILFADDGTAKLADFGIAKLLEQPEGLTMTGTVVGTPAYLSPEVALGEDPTPASDVYALGVVLYELLCGTLPYPSRPTAAAALLQRVNEDPVPLTEVAPQVPARLAAVVMRAMARDPGERFATATSFAGALAPFLREDGGGDDTATQAPMGIVARDGLPAPTRRRGVLVGAIVAVVLLVAAATVAILVSGGGGDDTTAATTTTATGAEAPTSTTDTTSTGSSSTTGGVTVTTSANFAVLTDANTKFRTFCSTNFTEAQCQCAMDRIPRDLGLTAYVDVANDLASTGRTNRPNAIAIMSQCASR